MRDNRQRVAPRTTGTARVSVLWRVWRWFSTLFTIGGLVYLAVLMSPLPVIEHNSATVLNPSLGSQIATAKALATALGEPYAELHTDAVNRYLFKDGTSVDHVITDVPNLMYEIAALKSVVLGHFARRTPIDVAGRISEVLEEEGYPAQVIMQPDPAFPPGELILILSDAFRTTPNAGFGILIRRTALRIDGPIPDRFDGLYR